MQAQLKTWKAYGITAELRHLPRQVTNSEEARPSEYRGIGINRSGLILVSWGMVMWIMSSLISRGEWRDLGFP